MLRVKLLGDHSNYHAGSAAAFRAIRAEVERYGLIVGEDEDYDLLVVNGEGSTHHGSKSCRRKLEAIREALDSGKRARLVNAVWEANPPECAEMLDGCEQIVVREAASCRELSEAGIQADISLDQSYFDDVDEDADYIDFSGKVVMTDFYATDFGCFVWLNSTWAAQFPRFDLRAMSWSSAVKSLRTASLLVTGRHHAMYAACRARTPFISYVGNTGNKTRGLFEWAEASIPDFAKLSLLKRAVNSGKIPHEQCSKLFDFMERQKPWRLV